ncbi:MAG: PEP-CTERM sorting domain-containing protein, partial [Pirellulales bacterium]
AADYTVWRDTLGQLGSGLDADGSGNNQIDVDDYTIWKSNFGHVGGGGANAIAAVPESATAAMLVAATLAMLLRRCSLRPDASSGRPIGYNSTADDGREISRKVIDAIFAPLDSRSVGA